MTQSTKMIDPDTELDAPKTQAANDTQPAFRRKSIKRKTDIIPASAISPSTAEYEYALTLRENDYTYVVAVNEYTSLKYINGTLYINGKEESKVSIVDVRNNNVTELDGTTLAILYSIIWVKLKEKLDSGTLDPIDYRNFGATVFAPDLARVLYKDRGDSGYSQNEIDEINRKLYQLSNYIGIINDKVGNKVMQSKYPVLLWSGYDVRNNTISFLTPFLNRLVMDNYNIARMFDSYGQPLLKHNGAPRLRPVNTHLIKSSIANERNKRACEIVRCICNVIERTGSNYPPRIKAQTIVDRVYGFNEALDKCKTVSARTVLLNRAFKKAFELLETKTFLKDVYKNIVLPSEIPTATTLSKIVYCMPHKGKNQSVSNDIINGEYN